MSSGLHRIAAEDEQLSVLPTCCTVSKTRLSCNPCNVEVYSQKQIY